jgi:hypothetical protein
MMMTPGPTRAPHHLKGAGGRPWPSLARLANANGHSKRQMGGKILDDEECQVDVDGNNIHEMGIESAEVRKTRHSNGRQIELGGVNIIFVSQSGSASFSSFGVAAAAVEPGVVLHGGCIFSTDVRDSSHSFKRLSKTRERQWFEGGQSGVPPQTFRRRRSLGPWALGFWEGLWGCLAQPWARHPELLIATLRHGLNELNPPTSRRRLLIGLTGHGKRSLQILVRYPLQ